MDSSPSMPEKHHEPEGWGGVVAIMIIVALLIAAGIYFFLKEKSVMHSGQPAVGAVQV